MLHRLLTHVVDIVMPESQCGFRRNRSTVDMIFVARLLQEKCREQHSSLYLAFIDLTKAFDTVNRTLLWDILSKFGCTPQFLAVVREFHDGMSARVVLSGLESDPFMVNVEVKQGCVLAPVRYLTQRSGAEPTTRNASNTGSRLGNFAGSDTSSECHRTVFPAVSSTGHYSEVRGLSGVRRSASPFIPYRMINCKISLQTERDGAIRANKG